MSTLLRAPRRQGLMTTHRTLSIVAAVLLLAAACNDKDGSRQGDRGPAPPPAVSSTPGACAKGGGTSRDEVTAAFFPRTSGDYCIDPNGESRAYGENAKRSLGQVCTELFDGECEVYRRYGLKRVVTLRYVDGEGSPGAVSVTLSRFASVEGAYGFFTKRVIADADPAETKPRRLDAGAAAQLGGSNANVWRGRYVLELAYNNEREAPDAMRASTARVVPPLARAIGEKLPGAKKLPEPAARLPTANGIDLGVSYSTGDLLGVRGVGPGATGYYREGTKRWRVLSVVSPDAEAAKDVVKTLGKLKGATKLEGTPFDGVRFTMRDDEESPRVEWVVGRKDRWVVGVGDEEDVLSADQSAAEAAALNLSVEQKSDELRAILGG